MVFKNFSLLTITFQPSKNLGVCVSIQQSVACFPHFLQYSFNMKSREDMCTYPLLSLSNSSNNFSKSIDCFAQVAICSSYYKQVYLDLTCPKDRIAKLTEKQPVFFTWTLLVKQNMDILEFDKKERVILKPMINESYVLSVAPLCIFLIQFPYSIDEFFLAHIFPITFHEPWNLVFQFVFRNILPASAVVNAQDESDLTVSHIPTITSIVFIKELIQIHRHLLKLSQAGRIWIQTGSKGLDRGLIEKTCFFLLQNLSG